jgi:hypothetical protein
VTAWDELLAVTHPGTEVEAAGATWLTLRRSYREHDDPDRLTLTVEFVRAGSSSDPRRPPADAPRPTQPEGH